MHTPRGFEASLVDFIKRSVAVQAANFIMLRSQNFQKVTGMQLTSSCVFVRDVLHIPEFYYYRNVVDRSDVLSDLFSSLQAVQMEFALAKMI